jgi:3-oxoacyl-[acyl-carrier-protein] synthase II
VVVTGLGTVNPIGLDVCSTWDGLINGISGVGPITLFDTAAMKTKIAAEVKGFDSISLFGSREARRMDRFTHFALAAAQEAINDAGLVVRPDQAHRIGAVMGSGIGGITTLLEEAYKMLEKGERYVSPHLVPMMLVDTAPARIAIEFGLRGPNLDITTACASSTNAIGEASAIIARGAADAMIAGGSEAGLVPLALAGFANMGALSNRNDEPERASRPFERDRDGFVPGEGAAVLVLESLDHAQARGARIYAEVLGYGASADAYHMTAPLDQGEGAVQAMLSALHDAGIEPGSVDYINAHGTSTPLNDKAETRAIKQVFGDAAYQIPVSSTKSMTGHLMGAAGALEALVCVKTLEKHMIPPTVNYEIPDPTCDLDYVPNRARKADVRIALSNSFGFGGHNASLVLGTLS